MKFLYGLLLGVGMGGICVHAQALSPKERLTHVERELAQAHSHLERYEQDQEAVLDQIAQIEQKMSDLVENEHTHQEKISELQSSIECLKEQQAKSLESLHQQHCHLSKVLGALRHLSSHSAVISLAATKSKNDLVHTGILLRQLVPHLKNVSCELRQELSELGALRDKISETEEFLSQTRSQVEKERESLTQLLKAKKSLQESTREKQEKLELEWRRLKGEVAVLRASLTTAEIAQLPPAFSRPMTAFKRKEEKGKKKAEKALEKQKEILQERGEKETREKGEKEAGVRPLGEVEISAPVSGGIQESYGVHRRFARRGKGVVFQVTPGEMVRAPLSGRLSLVKEEGPQGILIMIDGGDYQVVCSGLSALFFPAWTMVKRGQIIGRVEEETPAGLYLDVRRFGHSLNPLSLLKGKKPSSGRGKEPST